MGGGACSAMGALLRCQCFRSCSFSRRLSSRRVVLCGGAGGLQWWRGTGQASCGVGAQMVVLRGGGIRLWRGWKGRRSGGRGELQCASGRRSDAPLGGCIGHICGAQCGDQVERAAGGCSLCLGTCSGAITEGGGEQIELDLCPAAGWRRRHRRWAKQQAPRARAKRGQRDAQRPWEWQVRLSGREPDDRGFWPVDCLLAVKRPARRWAGGAGALGGWWV